MVSEMVVQILILRGFGIPSGSSEFSTTGF